MIEFPGIKEKKSQNPMYILYLLISILSRNEKDILMYPNDNDMEILINKDYCENYLVMETKNQKDDLVKQSKLVCDTDKSIQNSGFDFSTFAVIFLFLVIIVSYVVSFFVQSWFWIYLCVCCLFFNMIILYIQVHNIYFIEKK